MSPMHSAMNITGTALTSTEFPPVLPEVNVSQLPMDAATHQDLCRQGEGSTYSCHLYQQKFFFVRASDMIGFSIAEGVSSTLTFSHTDSYMWPPAALSGLPGLFSFSIIKRCLEGGGGIQHRSMFNTPFLSTYTMQSFHVTPHAVPHLQEWRTIFSDSVISV